MVLYEDDGSRWEVDDSDCEFEDGGCWLLTENGEDEEFYDYCEDAGDED